MPSMTDWAARHQAVTKELAELFAAKNEDYGDSFHRTFLEEGMAAARVRLTDKLNRFKALTKGKTANVKDESVRDTLLDLANYAIMTVMELDYDAEPSEAEHEPETFIAALTASEFIIAGMLGAEYITRDNDENANVEFWKHKPLRMDDTGIYYVSPIDECRLATINAKALDSHLKPYSCVCVHEEMDMLLRKLMDREVSGRNNRGGDDGIGLE